MKKLIRLFLPILLFSFFLSEKTLAQVEVIIVGPTELCFGECGTYDLMVLDSNGVILEASWFVDGNVISNEWPVTICATPNTPDGISIFVNGTASIDQGTISDFQAEFFVNVTTSITPNIISTSALCPADSLGGACEKICAFNTATYEVTGIPPGTTVDWQVLGAQNVTTNGTEVIVEWGAPGQGEVSVNVGNSSTPTAPLQLFCGQWEQTVFPNGEVGGIGYVVIDGGSPPYEVLISSPSGMFSMTFSTPGIHLIPDLPADLYSVVLTNGGVISLVCEFEIVPDFQTCWLSTYPSSIEHPFPDADCCGGILEFAAVGGEPPYTYLWSNGSTVPIDDFACEGTYSVTVVDAFGCEAVTTVSLVCEEPSSCGGSASLCVEILEEPKAVIASIPPAANGVIEICQGQTVYFENESLNATSYAWDFGDLNTSAQFEPNHTFDVAGSFTVSLIAQNECFCADTATVEVNVLPAAVPEVNCVGTICEGETVTYSTDAMCSTYIWAVTGSANVLGGGGPSDDFITVEWLAGPEGTLSLEVAGCAGTVCNAANVIPIPIISDAVQIQGAEKVCEGSTEEYFIPNYQGTEINWSVVGSGNITEDEGERVTINWYGEAGLNNPQLVIVEFENCYLGCGGRDTLEVNIVPSFFVEGPIEVCENSTTDYVSRNTITGAPIPSNWEVFNSSATSVWTSGGAMNTASIPWNLPEGSYTVRATAANTSGFCNDTYDVFVKLVEAPPPVMSISGEDEICPGETYTYLANGISPNDFTWTVTGGSPATVNGSPANVVWDAAGPYSLSVVQIATTGLACTSDPTSLAVGPIPAFSVTGDDQVCLEEVGTYSVPFFESIDYQWSISPTDAGIIISGDGSETVGIQWNDVGAATVSVNVCGAVENFNVNVLALPQPVAQHPANICAGDMVVVTTTTPFSSYSWKDEDGTEIFTVPNPMLGGGHYEVEVTDADGCLGDTIFRINERALPPVSISLPAYEAICPGGPDITLYSVTIGGGGYTYEWFHDGSPIGGNTPDLVTNLAGNYSVVVTDANGCTASSETETLLDCSSVGGVCVGGMCTFPGGGCTDCTLCPGACNGPCQSAGNIDFTFSPTANCDALAFMNASTLFVPGSLSWNFDDPASGAANTSNLENPTHEFTDIGYYTVLLTGLIEPTVPGAPPCFDFVFYDVLIPVKANFAYDPVCPGDAMPFTDLSIFVTGGNITDWTWDFGDPGSGADNTSNLQNPTHAYSTPGAYTVTLTLTEASGCQVSASQMVEVYQLPLISFPLPGITCENTALPFDAIVPPDYASLDWNFGDPGSGVGNTSEIQNTFHAFDAPGPYTVTLSATSIQGCMNTFSDVVDVTANPLGGNIAFSQPPPICEGDSVVLTAPPGGTMWDWTTNSAAEEISTYVSGVFDVTVTNADGCTYSPPGAIVDVLAEPNGIIKAVEYNDFGQPVAFFETPYLTCEGEDVYLVVQGSADNSYVWNTGEPGEEVSFTEEKDNLLAVGTHIFTVTVTDGTTGCTSEEGPFEVIVNPIPDVQIASMPSGFLCENTSATLNIVAPDPMLNYQWNTGETTTSIMVIAGGTYFAQATNQFGCKNRSNEIDLNNAPDIDLIPSGCLDRCDPDTMCLPPMGFVNSYQWYLDGSPLPAPNGTMEEPIFDQSGEYHVVMTDIFGCTATSGALTLDLFPGFGDILGNVWYDVNGNGTIDGPDTLVNGIDIILTDGSAHLDTATAGMNGYIFPGVTANGYTVELDTMSLPAGWTSYWLDGNLNIDGCEVEEGFDWLVVGCLPATESLTFDACPGDGVMYDGVLVPAGTTQNFSFASFNGCDSIVSVTVAELAADVIPLEIFVCENETTEYDGVTLSPGDAQDFVFQNVNGCDSTMQVTVSSLPTSAEPLQLSTCPGVPVTYAGASLNIGDVQDFVFTNQSGCDSTVTVTVTEAGIEIFPVELETCEGTTIQYESTDLAPGDVQQFILTDVNGCDSIVEVTVYGLPNVAESFFMSTCDGEPVNYQGTTIPAGGSEVFVFQNYQGCDSVVTVNVVASPVDTVYLAPEICEGETFGFNGSTLAIGESSSAVFLNQFGCDSLVFVDVLALPPVNFDLAADTICWNADEGSVEVKNIAGSTAPYLVSLDGLNYQMELIFENLNSGPYTVFLQDANGCIFENPTEVSAVPPIVVVAQDETMTCGDEIRLAPQVSSELPYSLLWPDGSNEETFTVNAPGIYTLRVENDCEVMSRDIAVALEPTPLASQIYMPNSFSPNGDGINDCYQGYLAPNVNVEYFLLRIFDRWGNQMFESNDPAECWDGLFRGEKMDPAVFAWFVEIRVLNCDGLLLDYFEEGGIHLMK